MIAKKTLLAVPSAVAALAFLAPSPALAITGYAGAPTAVAAQYPTSANSQSATPTSSSPTTSAPSLTQTPTTSPGTQGDGSTPSTEDVSNVTSNPSQPAEQVVAGAGSPSSSLPFTGYAAIVAMAAGFALLLGGVAARRVSHA
jgi:cobalamin biosynthesis Mg chelatase CobN